MKHIAYILTMPNVGSWNGKFTGEGKFYCTVKSYMADSNIPQKVLSMKYGFRYDFGDGWSANIKAEQIKGNQKAKYRRESKGFYGYEWMITEIEEFGRIKTRAERDQEKRLEGLLNESKRT